MADKKQPKANAKTATATTAADSRPSGKNYKPSEKYHYHKDEANKAFKAGDIVKSSNHILAMRRAEKTLREQAEWAKKNKPR